MSYPTPPSNPRPDAPAPKGTGPDWLRVVQEKVETLRYGVVQLVVHEGRVTQIERTEKTRLPAASVPQPDKSPD